MEEKKSKVEDLALLAKDGKIEIVHRNGPAEEFLKPIAPIEKIALEISGNIDTVFEFLKKRSKLFKPDNCHISVSAENHLIAFKGNDQQSNNDHTTLVIGKMSFSKEFDTLPLNESFEPLALAKALRLRKHLFTDAEQFRKLFSELSSFKATVSKKIEESDDRTGNATSYIKQEVIHNLSNIFTLKMEVLKGAKELSFDVEIDIDPTDLNCTLVAPELSHLIQEQAKNLLNAELEKEISDGVKMKDFCFVYNY